MGLAESLVGNLFLAMTSGFLPDVIFVMLATMTLTRHDLTAPAQGDLSV